MERIRTAVSFFSAEEYSSQTGFSGIRIRLVKIFWRSVTSSGMVGAERGGNAVD